MSKRLLVVTTAAALAIGAAVAPAQASLSLNAITLNAITLNAITLNSLAPTAASLGELNGVSVEGVTLPTAK